VLCLQVYFGTFTPLLALSTQSYPTILSLPNTTQVSTKLVVVVCTSVTLDSLLISYLATLCTERLLAMKAYTLLNVSFQALHLKISARLFFVLRVMLRILMHFKRNEECLVAMNMQILPISTSLYVPMCVEWVQVNQLQRRQFIQ